MILAGMDLMEREPRREEPATVSLQRAHERLVAPIVARDPEGARQRMDDHLRGAVANYVAASQEQAAT